MEQKNIEKVNIFGNGVYFKVNEVIITSTLWSSASALDKKILKTISITDKALALIKYTAQLFF